MIHIVYGPQFLMSQPVNCRLSDKSCIATENLSVTIGKFDLQNPYKNAGVHGLSAEISIPACIFIIEGEIGCFIHQFAPSVVNAECERARLTLAVYQQQVIYIVAVGGESCGHMHFSWYCYLNQYLISSAASFLIGYFCIKIVRIGETRNQWIDTISTIKPGGIAGRPLYTVVSDSIGNLEEQLNVLSEFDSQVGSQVGAYSLGLIQLGRRQLDCTAVCIGYFGYILARIQTNLDR